MLCLGLDPGREGGGVLALDGQAIAVVSWRAYTRNKRRQFALSCARPQGAVHEQRGLAGAWAIGEALRTWLGPVVMLNGGQMLVGCEGAHIGRNAHTGLALSRWGGALAGPLEQWAPHHVATWAEPSEWRKVSFRTKWWVKQAEADGKVASMAKAKRMALAGWDPALHTGLGRPEIDRRLKAAAKVMFLPMREAAKREAMQVMPGLVPGLAELVAQVGGSEHVYDAAGICRWRWLQGE